MTNPSGAHAVLLFDGVCNLCNGGVVFIVKRDPRGRIHFATLQSGAAGSLLRSIGIDPAALPESMVLVEGGRAHTRSAAALRLVRNLRFPWPLLYAFVLVPRPLRDWLYNVVARHRYRWFGKRDVCMVPTPELRGRFLSPE